MTNDEMTCYLIAEGTTYLATYTFYARQKLTDGKNPIPDLEEAIKCGRQLISYIETFKNNIESGVINEPI